MSTTDVIIKHLISGIQAATWLLLLTALLFSGDWASWDIIKDIPTELFIAFISITYPIGIFVDKMVRIIKLKNTPPGEKQHETLGINFYFPRSTRNT